MTKSIKALYIFILLALPSFLNAQDATSFLVGIFEAHNRQLGDLQEFIAPDAKCHINGQISDSSALRILSKNFDFLNAVYPQAEITLQNLVANKSMAVAEWVFTDSIGEVGNGMISIKLENKKVSTIKIYNGKISDRSQGNSSGRARRPSGGLRGRNVDTEEQSWWYYLRVSLGGFIDPAGIHFSSTFTCKSPALLPEKFKKSDLKGPFPDRQSAAKALQTELAVLKISEFSLHATEASCAN